MQVDHPAGLRVHIAIADLAVAEASVVAEEEDEGRHGGAVKGILRYATPESPNAMGRAGGQLLRSPCPLRGRMQTGYAATSSQRRS